MKTTPASPDAEVTPVHLSTVATLNLLTYIQDRPDDSQTFQKSYQIKPAETYSMILAIRPRWDTLIDQTIEDMRSWSTEHMRDVLHCERTCDCHFYHEVFEREPALKEKFTVESFSWLDQLVSKRDHRNMLYCLKQGPAPDPALIKTLRKESKDFEAEAAF